jgi:putative membrane protein
MGLAARPARALVLVAWAGFFISLWVVGDSDRYLGPRTTWVVPFGAITLSLAAVGYGLLALKGRPSRPLARTELLGHLALILPILAVLVVPRAELGAQAARKKDTNRGVAVAELAKAKRAAAKAAVAAAKEQEISKIDFLSIASVTSDPGYAGYIGVRPGTRVQFVGFAVTTGQPDRFRLARFLISCCAADAVPAFVEVSAEGQAIPPDNAWLKVTGQLVKNDQGKFVVAAESMEQTPAPSNPYITSWGL